MATYAPTHRQAHFRHHPHPCTHTTTDTTEKGHTGSIVLNPPEDVNSKIRLQVPISTSSWSWSRAYHMASEGGGKS